MSYLKIAYKVNRENNESSWDFSTIFNNYVKKEIILCIGKVQSGKTSKYLALIKKSFDENFRIVIIFGGTGKNLLSQTQNRLEESFKDNKNILINPKCRINDIENNKIIVFNILKHPARVNELITKLEKVDLSKNKILIIDDESDFATVNTDSYENRSTYESIGKLYERIDSGKLLLITATPFANILSNNSCLLKPERIISWKAYDEYCGLKRFNGNKKNYERIEENNKNGYLKEILQWFILTCLYKNNNFDFLINPGNHINIHDEFEDKIQEILSNYRIMCSSYEKIIKVFKSYSDIPIYQQLLADPLIHNKILLIINKIKIILFNEESNFDEDSTKCNIIIGGFKVSRGFTFKHMIGELILINRQQKINVDTLLQKCRWFGPRITYINDMKIYGYNETFEALKEAEDYISIFKNEQEYNFDSIKSKLIELDKKSKYVQGTNYGKKR